MVGQDLGDKLTVELGTLRSVQVIPLLEIKGDGLWTIGNSLFANSTHLNSASAVVLGPQVALCSPTRLADWPSDHAKLKNSTKSIQKHFIYLEI